MNVVFDLDGTLIDSRERLYRLFQQLVPESRLSFSDYWTLKRKKTSNEEILAGKFGFDSRSIATFLKSWMELIEDPQLLALDASFPCIHEALARLQDHAALHVCTARQHSAAVLDQLDRLKLLPFFKEVMVTEQQQSKESLIRRRLSARSGCDWILGDTGKDVQVGKALALKTCAVLSGFLNRGTLLQYQPDLVLNSAVEFSPSHLRAG